MDSKLRELEKKVAESPGDEILKMKLVTEKARIGAATTTVTFKLKNADGKYWAPMNNFRSGNNFRFNEQGKVFKTHADLTTFVNKVIDTWTENFKFGSSYLRPQFDAFEKDVKASLIVEIHTIVSEMQASPFDFEEEKRQLKILRLKEAQAKLETEIKKTQKELKKLEK